MVYAAVMQHVQLVDDAAGLSVAQCGQRPLGGGAVQQAQPQVHDIVRCLSPRFPARQKSLFEVALDTVAGGGYMLRQIAPVLMVGSQQQAFSIHFPVRQAVRLLVPDHLQPMLEPAQISVGGDQFRAHAVRNGP